MQAGYTAPNRQRSKAPTGLEIKVRAPAGMQAALHLLSKLDTATPARYMFQPGFINAVGFATYPPGTTPASRPLLQPHPTQRPKILESLPLATGDQHSTWLAAYLASTPQQKPITRYWSEATAEVILRKPYLIRIHTTVLQRQFDASGNSQTVRVGVSHVMGIAGHSACKTEQRQEVHPHSTTALLGDSSVAI